jgi:TolB-like protein
MRGRVWVRMCMFVLTGVLLTTSSWAGQIVTDDLKTWAKEVLEQEEKMGALGASNTVAVLYFHNQTGVPEFDLLGKGLSLMILTDLSKAKGIQVVERAKLQALVQEMGLGASGLVDPDTSPRVGRLLGAGHLVGGNILKEKVDAFRLKAGLVNTSSKEVVGRPAVDGKLLVELLRMEKDLVFEIIQSLNVVLTPEEEAAIKQPLTESLAALMSLFKGLEESDLGNYLEAEKAYRKALQQDPNLTIAETFLEELVRMRTATYLGQGAQGPSMPAVTGLLAGSIAAEGSYILLMKDEDKEREVSPFQPR